PIAGAGCDKNGLGSRSPPPVSCPPRAPQNTSPDPTSAPPNSSPANAQSTPHGSVQRPYSPPLRQIQPPDHDADNVLNWRRATMTGRRDARKVKEFEKVCAARGRPEHLGQMLICPDCQSCSIVYPRLIVQHEHHRR